MTQNNLQKPKLLILGGSSMLAYLWSKEVEQFYDIYLSLHKRKINYFQYKFLDIMDTYY